MSRATSLRVLAANQFGRLLPAEELLLELAQMRGEVAYAKRKGKRKIRVALLHWLLLSRDALEQIAPSGLKISDACIVGPGDLRGIQAPFWLRFVRCDLPHGIDVSAATIRGDLSFEGSRIGRGIKAKGIRVDGDIVFDFCKVRGKIDFFDAAIKGSFSCQDAVLEKRNGIAASLWHAQIGGSVVFDRSVAHGEVTLRGAAIKGSVRCRGASFTNEGDDGKGNPRTTLHGNGFQVEGSVLLDDQFESRGAISMVGATIGGNLRLSDAKLVGTLIRGKSTCLVADLASIRGSIISSRFESSQGAEVTASGGLHTQGEVRMFGVHVEGNVGFNASSFSNVDAALVLRGAEIGGTLSLARGFSSWGEVSTEGAKVGRNLNCTGGTFLNSRPLGRALNARGIRVQGFVRLMDDSNERAPHGEETGVQNPMRPTKDPTRPARSFWSFGEVNFDGARIDGDFDCTGGYFATPIKLKTPKSVGGPERVDRETRWALSVQGSRIGGSLLLEDGLHAVGGVSLAGSQIGRSLRCVKGKFVACTAEQAALEATTIEVEGNAKLDRGEYSGQVTLKGATIHGDLDFTKSTLTGKESRVHAENLFVTDCFYWRDLTIEDRKNTELDLTNAKVGTLVDQPELTPQGTPTWTESWPQAVKLEGFVYNALSGSVIYKERKKWLAHLGERSESRPAQWRDRCAQVLKWFFCCSQSSIQPYQQLARVLRASGHEQPADRIMWLRGWTEIWEQPVWEWVLILFSALVLLFFGYHYLQPHGTFDSASSAMFKGLHADFLGTCLHAWSGRRLWVRHLLLAFMLFAIASLLFLKPARLLVLGLGVGFGYKRWLPVFWFCLLLAVNWGVFLHWADRISDVQPAEETQRQSQLVGHESTAVRVSAEARSAELECTSLSRPPDFSPFFYSLDALIFLFTPQNLGEVKMYRPRDPQHCMVDRRLRLLIRGDSAFGAVLLVLFVAAMTGIIRRD